MTDNSFRFRPSDGLKFPLFHHCLSPPKTRLPATRPITGRACGGSGAKRGGGGRYVSYGILPTRTARKYSKNTSRSAEWSILVNRFWRLNSRNYFVTVRERRTTRVDISIVGSDFLTMKIPYIKEWGFFWKLSRPTIAHTNQFVRLGHVGKRTGLIEIFTNIPEFILQYTKQSKVLNQ